MKKIISLIVLAGVVAAGAALGAGAGNPLGKAVKVLPVEQEVRVAEQAAANASALERIIAPNPSVLENVSYWLKGCRKVQQTKDEVALNCPPGVGQQLISQGKARQDRLFQVVQ